MDIWTYRGVNINSDHYLTISMIRGRISNARKSHGTHSKKFNCKRLEELEVASSCIGRLDE
jgi:hypothetical protein